MKVDVAELRRAANRLFDHLEQQGVHQIEIVHDHYWEVPADVRYDVYGKPAKLDIGQLSEDLDNLRSLEKPTESPVGYGLVWLAQLLREVGQQHVG